MGEQTIQLSVLGPLRGLREGRELELGAPQQRALLAVLLVAGVREPVGIETVSDVLWPSESPVDRATMVHQYISRLRRTLGPAPDGRRWIERTSRGYRLSSAAEVDLTRFRELARRPAAVPGEPALTDLIEALRLWRGPVAADLPSTVREHSMFLAVDQEHATVLRTAADLAVAQGRAGEVVAVLEAGVAWHAYDEGLQARLLSVLVACDRRPTALDRYRAFRERLVDELGVEPGSELQRVHREILRDPVPGGFDQPMPLPTRPAQLPVAPKAFTGRAGELGDLGRRIGDGHGEPILIVGLGGVGKTAFAIHWAHHLVPGYPDGQLFVDLRGFAPAAEPLSPATVLRGFLDAFGVPRSRQPDDLPALAALYRSTLADRRVLVVLDNAADEEQVRPLLPGGPGCRAVVTSRRYLGDLVAREGAETVLLGPLPDESSRSFLSAKLGAGRVGAEPEALTRIIDFCGGLPLALAICAAWAIRHPGFPLSAIAEEIAAAGGLDAFTVAGSRHDVRTVFSWSYRQLSEPAAQLFRRTGLLPGPEVSRTALASLAGMDATSIRAALDELVDANLLTEYRPGRYVSHDLVRAFAAELGRTEPEDERRAAIRRLMDHYLHTAIGGVTWINSERLAVDSGSIAADVTPVVFGSAAAAVSWFGTERDNLRSAFDLAAETGLDSHLWRFVWALNPYLQEYGGAWAESVHLASRALIAAQRHGETWWQWYLLNTLGRSLIRVGRSTAGRDYARQMVDLGRECGEDLWTAYGLGGIAASHVEGVDRPDAESAALAFRYAQEALDLCGRLLADEAPADRARSVLRLQAAILPLQTWHHLYADGGLDAAVECLHRSLEIRRSIGDRVGQQYGWWELGRLYGYAGDHAEGARAYRIALDLLPSGGMRAELLTGLAVCLYELGALDEALDRRDEAWLLMEGLNHSTAEQLREKLRALPGR